MSSFKIGKFSEIPLEKLPWEKQINIQLTLHGMVRQGFGNYTTLPEFYNYENYEKSLPYVEEDREKLSNFFFLLLSTTPFSKDDYLTIFDLLKIDKIKEEQVTLADFLRENPNVSFDLEELKKDIFPLLSKVIINAWLFSAELFKHKNDYLLENAKKNPSLKNFVYMLKCKQK